MRNNLIILIYIFSITSISSTAQIALNGAAEIFPYSGLQPELIKGVRPQHAVEKPLLRHVYLVDKNVVALTIDEKAVINSNLKPYIKQKGDTVIYGDYHKQSKILVRNGEKTGYVCGVNNNWYRPFNRIAGESLDTKWAAQKNNFALVSENDDNFGNPVNPVKVYRKTVPHRMTHIDQVSKYALRHEIYLVFNEDLKPGAAYSFEFDDKNPLKYPVSFKFDDSRLRSEAIHVNLHGYQPGDPKIAFLSTWLGDGGRYSYSEDTRFHVLDAETEDKVFSGKAILKSKGNEPEYKANKLVYNHNLTDVYELDFSALKEPGTYRVMIPGIGCSFEFEISEYIWEQTTRLMMKGFLHQRSGIEIGPPHTDYLRPRNMHPDDEITIHKCDVEKFFGDSDDGGQSSIFKRIQASILPGTEVPEAWGGWMDAGDFDQRMSHLYSVRRMIYLFEMNPEYFEKLDLNIPESDNEIPDILDEGRWCLDLFKRTQGVYEKGGVSWWVESIEHPRRGETSWLNSLPTAIIPPTPRACFYYAATAAQMALAVKKYDPKLSDEYLQSALDAVKWADENADAPDPFGRNPRSVTEAMAFVSLYRATGDKNWHKRLESTIQKVYPNGMQNDIDLGNSEIDLGNSEILINYLLMNETIADAELLKEAKNAVLQLADELVAGANENTYFIFKEKWDDLNRMVLPRGCVLPVVTALHVSGDKKYAHALSSTIQYTMGANPMNRSYISGLGERWYIPYHHDWNVANMPVPVGIPQFGPAVQTEDKWGWAGPWAAKRIEGSGLYPNVLTNWPFAEKAFNNVWIGPVNECTVRHPMGEILMLSGYLAAYNQ
ncbi:MAG: glycoside hydrolase family 9 protein [Tangfeifania sp.]